MALEDNEERFEDEEELEEGEQKSGGLSPKLAKLLSFIAIGLVGVILMIIITILVMSIKKADQSVQGPAADVITQVPEPTASFKLDKFRVNLDDPKNTKQVVVNTEIVLGFDGKDKKLNDELIYRREQITDKVQYVIAKKRLQDIDTARKREEYLKQEILEVVNSLLERKGVLNVYFLEFVISQLN